jgi:hypothetical protein
LDVSVVVNVIDDGALNVDTGVLNNGEIGLVAIPIKSIGLEGSKGLLKSVSIAISENTIAHIRTIIQYLSLIGKKITPQRIIMIKDVYKDC